MDGTQVAVVGLNEIMADFCAHGRQPDRRTAEEMLNRLEERNYIPSSESTRREYRHLLHQEYQQYLSAQEEQKQ